MYGEDDESWSFYRRIKKEYTELQQELTSAEDDLKIIMDQCAKLESKNNELLKTVHILKDYLDKDVYTQHTYDVVQNSLFELELYKQQNNKNEVVLSED